MINIIKKSFLLQLKQSLSRATFRFVLVLQPIFNCLLLYFILRGNSPERIGEYLFINVSVMNLWSAIVFSSASDLDREKRMGTLGSSFAAPADFRLIYFGKVLCNTVLTIVSFIITFVFIRFVLQLPITFLSPSVSIFLVLIMIISFAVMSMALGYVFLLYRNSLSWMNFLEYPIYVLSGIALPVSSLPMFLRPISDILPTRWIVTLLKDSFNHHYNLQQVIFNKSCLALVILTIIFAIILYGLNKVVDLKVMDKGNLEVY